MAALSWTQWLPAARCYRAIGRSFIWFLRPSVFGEQWVLSRVARHSMIPRPEGMGVYSDLDSGKAEAQSLEDQGAPSS